MKDNRHLFLVVFFLLVAISTIGQKIDTIYHINGNILTGDFKKMVYGVVTWKMDGMGTISYETPKIKTLKSSKQFEIKLKNGMTYFGSIDSSKYRRKINIVIADGRELVDLEQVVEIYPIKRNFWLRTSGDFGLGFNYTKGSDLLTFSFTGNIEYRKKNSYFYINWDDYNTYQTVDTLELKSTKADATIGWERLIKKKWSFGSGIGMSQNTELGTKLRLNLIATGIFDISYTSWNRLYMAGGLSVQRETPYDSTEIKNDLAGLLGITWKVFKYTNPKIWVDADITWLPYFTTAGRHRVDVGLSPKIGLVGNDLKLGFRFYYSYDSKPQTVSASKNDWGLSLEITYSFH